MPISYFAISARVLALSALALCTAPALAADTNTSTSNEAQQRYRQEMAACDSGQTGQPIAACRLEARNALEAARRGALTSADDFAANARARCQVHTGADRTACEARMGDEGAQQGSVKGGGILRKSVTVVPGS